MKIKPMDLEKLDAYMVVGADPETGQEVLAVSPGMTLQKMGAFVGVAIVNLLNTMISQHMEKNK